MDASLSSSINTRFMYAYKDESFIVILQGYNHPERHRAY